MTCLGQSELGLIMLALLPLTLDRHVVVLTVCLAGVLASRVAASNEWFIRRRPVNLSSADPLIAALGTPSRSVILFDGHCGLCNFWVDFVLRRDRKHRYVFSPLQSSVGRAVLRGAGVGTDCVDSVGLYESGFLYQRSTAILRVLSRLPGAWSLTGFLIVIPVTARDFVYDIIATRRYAWFGVRDTCRLPTPEERNRFL
jgi:predicted DCC family thiol-disulfide oxidoreductase YuxK